MAPEQEVNSGGGSVERSAAACGNFWRYSNRLIPEVLVLLVVIVGDGKSSKNVWLEVLFASLLLLLRLAQAAACCLLLSKVGRLRESCWK